MADDTSTPAARKHISRLLQAWTGEDPAARDALVPIVYDELHRLAHHYMRGAPATRCRPPRWSTKPTCAWPTSNSCTGPIA
jgi:hypothetical protein